MHPENLSGRPGARREGQSLRGCRQGRQGCSLAPDRAESELNPDWTPSLGAPLEKSSW